MNSVDMNKDRRNSLNRNGLTLTALPAPGIKRMNAKKTGQAYRGTTGKRPVTLLNL